MSISWNFWRISLFSTLLVGLAGVSCGHPSTGSSGTGGSTGSGGASNCTPGEELCTCLTGNTCNPGLACADDLNKCVKVPDTSGSGGSTSTGGSSATGGSSPGSGGVTSTGGTPASGGSTGTGGSATGAGGSSTGTGGSSGTNLVTNGDLSQGDTGWNIGQGNPSSSGVMNGQYCATVNSGSGTVLIGWGGSSVSANLMPNVSYTLSYQASTTSSLSSFDVHVGSAVAVGGSYPVDEDYANDSPGTNSLTTQTHTFTLTGGGDPQAGVAFIFAAGSGTATVCIDNLAITKN